MDETNVLGDKLEPCSEDPMTGYLRDGCCGTHEDDVGRHEICAVLTEEFLSFSKARGNDLTTPRPEHGFPGLQPGDRWCLCVDRWVEAHDAGLAPPVVLEATNEAVLDDIFFSALLEHEHDPDDDDGRPGTAEVSISSPKKNGDSPGPDLGDRIDD